VSVILPAEAENIEFDGGRTFLGLPHSCKLNLKMLMVEIGNTEIFPPFIF
jgi:hypothetical protein